MQSELNETPLSRRWLWVVTAAALILTFAQSPGQISPDTKLDLTTDAVVRTESAKEYTGGKRLYGNVEGDLLYAYDMAAVGQPLQPHLWARLVRL